VNWISLPELLLIHARVIDATGGVHGVINAGALESSLLRPFTSFGGRELFPAANDKIAALIHSIIAFHPFADGNKRTALVAADTVLRLNGRRIRPGPDVEEFFWSIARGEQTLESIAGWLTAHNEPLPGQTVGDTI
jgi:death on curing protein